VNASCARWARARKAASPAADRVALSRLGFPFAREVPIKRDAPSVTAGQRPSMAKTVYVPQRPPTSISSGHARAEDLWARATLKDVEKLCREARGGATGLAVEFRQSNHEGRDRRFDPRSRRQQGCRPSSSMRGAYTHTSVAIRDAVCGGSRCRWSRCTSATSFAREDFSPPFPHRPGGQGRGLCGFGVGRVRARDRRVGPR